MTSVGRRPDLHQLLEALHAICRIEADASALDQTAETFRVVLTFTRALCPDDWVAGEPKPMWLIEEIVEQLQAWERQCSREQQWVSKEEKFGASIDTLMTYWTEELKKTSEIRPENMLTRAQKQILSNTILRLKELKERREAGGVYSGTENRREKARKTWVEDEYEAPRREEEQRRQQEARDGAFMGWGEDADAARRAAEDLFRRYGGESWQSYFHDAASFFGFDSAQPKPPPSTSGNKRPWYVVLGVPAHATDDEVKKSYRRLARKYHPDRYKEADAHERMTEINTARDERLGGV